jgi:uncharacterized protein
MFSLQAMFGKGDKFFSLLEQSANAAYDSSQGLAKLLKNPDDADLGEFVRARAREKELAAQITKELVNTFVTVLEREDIETLSSLLYKIPKVLEKFAERFQIVRGKLPGVSFVERAEMVSRAVEIVVQMVHLLRKGMDLDATKALHDRLQGIEVEADRLLLDIYREAASADVNGAQLFLKKDLFDLLEKAIDRCRDVGNTVFTIVLKNA